MILLPCALVKCHARLQGQCAPSVQAIAPIAAFFVHKSRSGVQIRDYIVNYYVSRGPGAVKLRRISCQHLIEPRNVAKLLYKLKVDQCAKEMRLADIVLVRVKIILTLAVVVKEVVDPSDIDEIIFTAG